MNNLSPLTGFEWDSGNDRKNEKHGFSRTEAERIFFNKPLLVSSDIKHRGWETRFHAPGKTDAGRLLQITFTLRSFGQKLRVSPLINTWLKEKLHGR